MARKKLAGLVVAEPTKMPIAKINLAPYNPNRMTKAEMEGLKASLRKYGLVLNFVVQRKGSVMIGGHQRLAAARELCAEQGWEMPTEAWATVLDVDDATAKKLNVALNRHHGEFDPVSLGVLFSSIDASNMLPDDYLSIGFAQDEVMEAIRAALPPEQQADELERQASEIALSGIGRAYTLTIEFDNADQRDEAKSGLAYAAKKLGRKPCALVLEALKDRFAEFSEAKVAPRGDGA